MTPDVLYRLIGMLGRWAPQLFGAIALIGLAQLLGPMFGLSEKGVNSLSAAVAVGFVIWIVVSYLLNKNKSDRLASALVDSAGSSSPNEIRKKFEAVLRGSKRYQHDGRALRLHQMPWYLIIGPPGSGKTSALRGSGLRFPARDLIGAEAVRGVGGTRNCSWWISPEAMLIDTAGRFTSQSSGDGSDRIEWETFLDLLKENRPRQPINGVVVFIGAETLCDERPGVLEQHVTSIGERIREVTEHFQIALPVYLFISKMDRLPGFLELFEDATEIERREVLGVFLGTRDLALDPSVEFKARMQKWLRLIENRATAKMALERNRSRLDALLGLSAAIGSISERIGLLVSRMANVGVGEFSTDVRGIYFCSAVQTGEFLDRIVAAFGKSFSRQGGEESAAAGAIRSYFVEGALRQGVFAEAGLAGLDSEAVARSNRKFWIAVSVVASLALISLGLIGMSYFNNQRLLQNTSAALKIKPIESNNQNQQSLESLSALLRALDVTAPIDRDRPISHRFGLLQSPSLHQAVNDTYRTQLRNGLFPVLARLHELALTDTRSDRLVRFEILKSYFMLIGSAPKIDAELIVASSRLLLNQLPGTAQAGMPDTVERHLRAGLKQKLGALPIEKGVVERVRAALGADPEAVLADVMVRRIELGFKDAAIGRDFVLSEALGPSARQVFQFDPNLRVAPYFTADGVLYFDQNMDQALAELSEEAWVLQPDQEFDIAGMSRIREQVLLGYVERYTAAWDAILVAPKPIAGMRSFADAVSGRDSPILRFYRAIAPHLAPKTRSAPLPEAETQEPQGESRAADRLKQLSAGTNNAPALPQDRPLAGTLITDHFRETTDMIEGRGAMSLSSLGGLLSKINAELGSGSGSSADLAALVGGDPALAQLNRLQTIREMQANAGQYPEPISTWLRSALTSAGSSVTQQAVQQIRQDVSRRLNVACNPAQLNSYPFSLQAPNEVSLAELSQLFGQSGSFNTVFNSELAAKVNRSSSPWRFSAPTLGITASDLATFERADEVNQLFNLSGAEPATFSGSLSVISLSANALSVDLNIGTFSTSYAHGPVRTLPWRWSAGSGSTLAVFKPASGGEHTVQLDGVWSLLRAVDAYGQASANAIDLTLGSVGYHVVVRIQSSELSRLFNDQRWRGIRCP